VVRHSPLGVVVLDHERVGMTFPRVGGHRA
jgi:hypothetical protein